MHSEALKPSLLKSYTSWFCQQFHATVDECIVPIMLKILRLRNCHVLKGRKTTSLVRLQNQLEELLTVQNGRSHSNIPKEGTEIIPKFLNLSWSTVELPKSLTGPISSALYPFHWESHLHF